MKIAWIQPPKDAREEIDRQYRQTLVDIKAHELSEMIKRHLKEIGI